MIASVGDSTRSMRIWNGSYPVVRTSRYASSRPAWRSKRPICLGPFLGGVGAEVPDRVGELVDGMDLGDDAHRNGDVEAIFQVHDDVADRQRIDSEVLGDPRRARALLLAGLVGFEMGAALSDHFGARKPARQGEGIGNAVVFDSQFVCGAQKRLQRVRG